jgi:hypothetical protein
MVSECYSLLVARCWLLVAGYWLLVAGCWLLGTGCTTYYLLSTSLPLLIS